MGVDSGGDRGRAMTKYLGYRHQRLTVGKH